VYSYATGSSLRDLIDTRPSFGSDLTQVQHIAVQLLRALVHMHARDIIHRDINPSNVIIGADRVLKLVDFGLAKEVSVGGRTYSLVGTPAYMAPECCSGHNREVDWWALGIVIYEMCHCVTPWGARTRCHLGENFSPEEQQLLLEIRSMPFKWAATDAARGLCESLLTKSPQMRAGWTTKENAEQLLQDCFFADVEWGELEDEMRKLPVGRSKNRFTRAPTSTSPSTLPSHASPSSQLQPHPKPFSPSSPLVQRIPSPPSTPPSSPTCLPTHHRNSTRSSSVVPCRVSGPCSSIYSTPSSPVRRKLNVFSVPSSSPSRSASVRQKLSSSGTSANSEVEMKARCRKYGIPWSLVNAS